MGIMNFIVDWYIVNRILWVSTVANGRGVYKLICLQQELGNCFNFVKRTSQTSGMWELHHSSWSMWNDFHPCVHHDSIILNIDYIEGW